MTEPNLLGFWSDIPLLSALVWLTIVIVTLYLARRHVHGLLDVLTADLARLLRTAARLLTHEAERLRRRTHEVLLTVAEERAERAIEREFRRVDDLIRRELAAYPGLHRLLSEQIGRADEDYRHAAEEPPAPPQWLAVIEAVAAIDAKGDPALAKILADIHTTLRNACHDALLEYRSASQRRHASMARLQPYLRRLETTLDKLRRSMDGIEERGRVLDSQLARYEQLCQRDERRLRALQASTAVGFLAAGALLAVVGMGAVLNYHLIVGPLTLLQGLSESGAAVGATFLVTLQLALGLALTELTGLTRLFDRMADLAGVQRRRLAWSSGVLLVLLALTQAALAYLGYQPDPADPAGWIPRLGHVLMGLTLPLILAGMAVPLEHFLQSGRIVGGRLLAGTALLAGVLLRLASVAVARTGPLLTRLYDLLVFLPLWLEQALRRNKRVEAAEPLSDGNR
mgnify:CR=1 FL=1